MIKVTLPFERSTKRTHLYRVAVDDADGADVPAVTSIYVRRADLGEPPPAAVVVTIEAVTS